MTPRASILGAMRARVLSTLRACIGPTATIVTAIAAWAIFKYSFSVKDFMLPSPLGVARVFLEDPSPFLLGTRETAISAVIGFSIAVVGGVLLGSALSLSRTIERSVYPVTLLFQMVPLVAIAPLGMLIMTSLRQFQTDRVFVSVALAACVGFALFGFVSVASRVLLARWTRGR